VPRHSTRPAEAAPRAFADVDTLRRDQQERRARLIGAATELMQQVDYDKIQVKDVAELAGVALGTLYRYFNSKDHLFACALFEWASGFGDRVTMASDVSVNERVKRVYRRAARAFEREPRVYDVLIQLQGSKDEYATRVYRDFAKLQSGAFASALTDLPPAQRDDVVDVMSAVLSEGLRGRHHGTLSAAQLQARIDRAADLLLR
jgi:AcrR family transcriptional regulator